MISFSDSYLAVKGTALILPQRSECARTITPGSEKKGDIHSHLRWILNLLRSQDKIKVAVKLESRNNNNDSETHSRYMTLVSMIRRKDVEECIILGIDIYENRATIGLVLPTWSDLGIDIDGDGGFSVTTNKRHHFFKPVSVQTMWSALQCLYKIRDASFRNSYHPDGWTHVWIAHYRARVNSEQRFVNEWHTRDNGELRIVCYRRLPGKNLTEILQQQKAIRMKLKELMMKVDLEDVSTKDLRLRLEADLNADLSDFRRFVESEAIMIMRQMEAPSEIFEYLYLGTEWNASNIEELQKNGVGYILNVAREIDNFFVGVFEYHNVRILDEENAELLGHLDDAFKFILKAKNSHSKVLVHCKMGVSRSASTVIAFVMKQMGWTLKESYEHVKKCRNCIEPNAGFQKQLETYQGILDASKQRHNKLFRCVSVSRLHDAVITRSLDSISDPFIRLQTIDTKVSNYERTCDVDRPESSSPDVEAKQLICKAITLAWSSDTPKVESSPDGCYQMNFDPDDLDPDLLLLPANFDPDDLDPDILLSTDDSEWHFLDNSRDDDVSSLFHESQEDIRWNVVPSASCSPVTLLSYQPIDGGREPEDTTTTHITDIDLDDDDYVLTGDVTRKRRRGFYEVSMLLAGRRDSANERRVGVGASSKATSKEEEEDENRRLPLLHPDILLERVQQQYRKRLLDGRLTPRSATRRRRGIVVSMHHCEEYRI